jgi:nucleotide-binding universal stress UspA family protein
MDRILLPVDGSRWSERATRHVIALRAAGLELEVLVLNVQPGPIPGASRRSKQEVLRLNIVAADRAMRAARRLLAKAGLPDSSRIAHGDPARAIVKLARQQHCSQIVMGTRGLSALAALVLGSVAMKVVQLSPVPVTLVK